MVWGPWFGKIPHCFKYLLIFGFGFRLKKQIVSEMNNDFVFVMKVV